VEEAADVRRDLAEARAAGGPVFALAGVTGFEAVEDGACSGVDHVAMLAPPVCRRHLQLLKGYRRNDVAE
jgi:hypothetical protein